MTVKSMSFALTTRQIRDRTKTVTRRGIGQWKNLKAGDLLWAIEKGQGLKKGERQRRICLLVVVSVKTEPLRRMARNGFNEPAREGFPHMNPPQFIAMFCKALRCKPDLVVRRIEFRYVPGGGINA